MDWEGGVEMNLGPREQEESKTSALKIVLNFELSVTSYPQEHTFDISQVCLHLSTSITWKL